jgi:hypothetical protein
VHAVGVAEGGRRDGGGEGDHPAAVGEHDPGVGVQVDQLVDPPGGEVLRALVLPGVVDGLRSGDQLGQRPHVVGAHRAGGDPRREGERGVGHGVPR